MRSAAAGMICGATAMLLMAWLAMTARPSAVWAQPGHSAVAGSGELVVVGVAGEAGRHVVVVDPRTRVMSVYAIDGASGQIQLRSVRNVAWDLLVEEFNGGKPSPSEVRAIMQTR